MLAIHFIKRPPRHHRNSRRDQYHGEQQRHHKIDEQSGPKRHVEPFVAQAILPGRLTIFVSRGFSHDINLALCPLPSAAEVPTARSSHKLIGLPLAFPYPTKHPPAANSPPAPAPSNPAPARSTHKPVATRPAAPRDRCSKPPAAAYNCPQAKRSPEARQPRCPPRARHKSAKENP